MTAPPTRDALTGLTLLERYRIGPPLGRGGMGVVYRAQDTLLDRPVAVKVLSGSELDDERRDRWLREARAAARLQHPHVVTVFDAGLDADRAFIVMELVEGETLRALGTLPPAELLPVARQLCDALTHIHAHGVVHRDLKPENVLVLRDGGAPMVKLTDLGLAWVARATRITQEGALVGTADYLAPEQILGTDLDGRADLYALGVMLYEQVTGRVPFAGDDLLAVVSQHLYAPVVPPRTFREDVNPALESAILRCLAKDPNQRFASAADLDQALMRVEAETSAAPPSERAPLIDLLARGRLIGRRAQLDQLRELWTRAMQGRSHLALLSGEPGVGKTRLARELIVVAQLHGAQVLQGGCYEFEAITPYLPFVEALRAWVRGQDPQALRFRLGDTAPELARLAPEIEVRLGPQPALATLSPQEERLRLFDAVTRFFQGLARDRGLLLFLDDLHWADHGSLGLLHYLMRNLREDRVLVLGGYREIELGRTHPLAAALVDWDRDRIATRIALGRLSRDDTERLIGALLGQEQVAPDLAGALYRETEGNPFFAEEVIKSLVEQQQLVREAGAWRRRDSSTLVLPQSVKAAVGRRLQRLTPGCIEVLHTAAALGKVFAFSELVAVAGLEENQLLDALDEASAAQLLRAHGGDSFAFTHDKIREVLHEELNPVRRRRLHLRIGEGLERLHATDLPAHAAVLAHHFAESTDLGKGLRYSLAAAEGAERIYAHEEALSLLERARDCAGALEDRPALADVEERTGRVHRARGDFNRAIAHFEAALTLSSNPRRRAALRGAIGEQCTRVGDVRGMEYLEAAMRDLDPATQAADLALAIVNVGRFHHYRAHHARAIEFLERARALAEPLDDPFTLTNVYTYLAGAYQHLARFDVSDAWARRTIELGERTNLPQAIASGHEFISENACNLGDWRRALHHAALNREFGGRSGSMDRMAWSLLATGWAHGVSGDLRASRKACTEGLELAERIGEGRLAIFQLSILAVAETDLGDPAALGHAEDAAERGRRIQQVVMRSSGVYPLARWLTAHGQAGDAVRLLEECLELGRDTDNRVHLVWVLPPYVEALLALARLEEAERAIGRGRALWREVGAQALEGIFARYEGERLVAAGRPDEALTCLDAAVARCEELDLRLELARSLRERATARRAGGDTAGAAADLGRAVELLAACGARPEEEWARRELGAARPS